MDERKDNGLNRQYVTGLITGLIISAFAVVVFLVAKYVVDNRVITRMLATDSQIQASGVTFKDKDFKDKVNEINKNIDLWFLNDTDESDVVEGAYKGMVNALDDPYSEYYTADEYKTVLESTSGTYKGIGVGVKTNADTGELVAVKVYDDSPAEKAGMKQDDIIVSINGTDVTGMDINDAVQLIRDAKSDNISLVIKRGDEKINVDVERTDIDANTVASKMYDGGVGYILLAGFEGVRTNQFAQAVNSLKEQGMKKLIIDIRDNPGGRLDVVCDILDLFVDKDKILVYTKDKYGKGEKCYAKYDASVKDMPICILVNGQSASASEVFAGVMKDYKLATIVGKKTFGKGIVQQLFKLSDGSAMKLTVSKYYLPNDENIHDKGIEPDVEVSLPGDAETLDVNMEDTQFNKAMEILNKE